MGIGGYDPRMAVALQPWQILVAALAAGSPGIRTRSSSFFGRRTESCAGTEPLRNRLHRNLWPAGIGSAEKTDGTVWLLRQDSNL